MQWYVIMDLCTTMASIATTFINHMLSKNQTTSCKEEARISYKKTINNSREDTDHTQQGKTVVKS